MLANSVVNVAAVSGSCNQSKLKFKILGKNYTTAVERFHAEEHISEIYEVSLWLVSEDKIHFNDVIQQKGLFTICGDKERHFHGIINNFTLTGKGGRFYFYQARIVPALWFLTLNKDFRIFQKRTTEEIVTAVLEENNILSDSYEFRLADKYPPKRYCSQYGESDFHFISRLLEEDGMFYFFEHTEDNHLLVFADDTAAYLDISGEATVNVHHDAGMIPENEVIETFGYVRGIRPGKVTQTNYNFKRPSLPLKVNKEGETHDDYEVYAYPGPYGYPDDGERMAKVCLEAEKTMEEAARGSGNCARFVPGFKFRMTCHDFNDLNRDYLLVSVIHKGSQSHVTGEYTGIGGDFIYSNEFTAIPATVTLRPEKIHRKPVVYGLQSAVVVGPEGEEIYVDEFCRVKVQFTWDREGRNDEKSSCWVRVIQTWGGGGYGSQFIPRIGDEVLISFQNGDPDWPILVGSVYNGGNMPINNLKKSVTQTSIKTKTHKGEGFHELRFDDAKGKEEVFLHSQKDMNVMVLDRRGETIGGDSGTVISKNCDLSVGGDSYTIVKGKSTEIGKEIVINADDSVTIVCGTSSIVIAPAGIKINGLQVDINDKSKAPKPPKRPVTGCTGRGGSGGGGKQSGGSAAKRDAQSAATPQQAIKEKPGKVASPVSEDTLQTEINGNSSGLGDFVSTGSPSPLLPTGGRTVPGDLVSSAGASLPSGLQNNIVGNGSALDNVAGLKDKAIREIKDRAAQELDKYKGSLLEKSGIGDMHSKMSKISEKPANLLSDTKINPDDLIKKF